MRERRSQAVTLLEMIGQRAGHDGRAWAISTTGSGPGRCARCLRASCYRAARGIRTFPSVCPAAASRSHLLPAARGFDCWPAPTAARAGDFGSSAGDCRRAGRFARTIRTGPSFLGAVLLTSPVIEALACLSAHRLDARPTARIVVFRYERCRPSHCGKMTIGCGQTIFGRLR